MKRDFSGFATPFAGHAGELLPPARRFIAACSRGVTGTMQFFPRNPPVSSLARALL
jgi:hypothetical protein